MGNISANASQFVTDIMIQARVGSTRLPGKILLPLGNWTTLGMMVERCKRVERARQVILLTTTQSQDDAVAQLGKKHDIAVYRGSEEDLIDRYLRAAGHYKSDVIVRLTGDCPFIAPELVDNMLNLYQFNWPNIENIRTHYLPKTNMISPKQKSNIDIPRHCFQILMSFY